MTFKSFEEAQSRHRELLSERANSGLNEHLQAAAKHFMRAAADSGAYIRDQEERSALQAMLDYWASVLFRSGVDVGEKDGLLADFDEGTRPTLVGQDFPYAGLLPYDESKSDQFYGRHYALEKLIARVKGERAIAIVGRHGSGATSLVQAGLISQVKAGVLDSDSDKFTVLPLLSPGPDLDAQTKAIKSYSAEKGRSQLLVLDNLDDLIGLDKQSSEITGFLSVLESFLEDEGNNNKLILVASILMQHEIEDGRFSDSTWLVEIFRTHRFRLSPMTRNEMRDAIFEPAKRIGLEFGSKVIDHVLDDVYEEASPLPLLQFTLMRLWRCRDQNYISYSSYLKVGAGVRGVCLVAEETWEGFSSNQRDIFREIFVRLLQNAPGASSSGFRVMRVQIRALESLVGGGPDFDTTLDKLLSQGLLKRARRAAEVEDSVELVHESIFQWQRYGMWLDEVREALRDERWLKGKASEWEKRKQLLSASALEHAQSCLERLGGISPSTSVTVMMEASRKAIRNKRMKDRMLLSSLIVSLVLLLAVLFVFYSSGAKLKKSNSELSQSLQSYKNSVTQTIGELEFIIYYQSSARLALKKGDRENYENDLNQAEQAARESIPFLRNLLGTIESGEVLELAEVTSTRVEPRRLGKPYVLKPIVYPSGDFRGVGKWAMSYQEESEYLGVALFDGSALVVTDIAVPNILEFEVFDGEPKTETEGGSDDTKIVDTKVYAIAFDEHGHYMAAAGAGNELNIWALTTDVTDIPGSVTTGPVFSCKFVEQEPRLTYALELFHVGGALHLAAGLDDDRAVIWKVEENCLLEHPSGPWKTLGVNGDVFSIDWQAEREALALGTQVDGLVIWNYDSKCKKLNRESQECPKPFTIKSKVFSVDFADKKCGSPSLDTGCEIVTSSEDGLVRVFEVDDQRIIAESERQEGVQLGTVRYSPDEKWIAVGVSDGSVRYWREDLEGAPVYKATGLGGPVFGLDFIDMKFCEFDCKFATLVGSLGGQVTRLELVRDDTK